MFALTVKCASGSRLAPVQAAGARLRQGRRLRLARPSAASSPHPDPLPVAGVPDTDANPEEPLEDTQAPRKKIFDDLGGAEGLKLAVDKFYSKVLDDDELLPYFLPVDMQKQKSKQVKFMAYVFGGPDMYQGKDMHTAHKHLQGLSHLHFDKIKQYLGETLQEMGVKQEVIDHAAAVVESTRPEFDFVPGAR